MAETSGTQYSQIIGDTQQTVSLAGAVIDLVGRTITSRWEKQKAIQVFKLRLGEWVDEAVDSEGRWLQPVLRRQAFEDHLVHADGHFQPQGQCKSSFAWAQLLYALNIRPKGGILSWRLPSTEIDPTVSGDLSLEVDGEVMCHVINLYRLYKHKPSGLSSGGSDESNDTQYDFPFGRLSLSKVDDRFSARFTPGANDDLSSQRVPFSYRVWFHPGTRLAFEKGSLAAAYFNAIIHHISDAAQIGDIPEPTVPLKERAEYLIRSLKMLKSRHECNASCIPECTRPGKIDWTQPKLVTPTWLAEASRILRRVTTNGGSDKGLVDFLISSLPVQEPENYDPITDTTGYDPLIPLALNELCLFAGESIEIAWMGRNHMSSRNARRERALAVLKDHPEILNGLVDTPAGSWLHGLSGMIPELLALLIEPHRLLNLPVLVLEVGPHHDLWGETCQVHGS
ncbi:hypothetical protein BDV19DRAFT_365136 [Aspergillus venezuelensis]